jgi:hypothetical protein
MVTSCCPIIIIIIINSSRSLTEAKATAPAEDCCATNYSLPPPAACRNIGAAKYFTTLSLWLAFCTTTSLSPSHEVVVAHQLASHRALFLRPLLCWTCFADALVQPRHGQHGSCRVQEGVHSLLQIVSVLRWCLQNSVVWSGRSRCTVMWRALLCSIP